LHKPPGPRQRPSARPGDAGRRTLRHRPTEGHHPRSAVCPRHPCMPTAIEDRIVVTDALGTQVKIKSEVFRDHVGLHDANGNPRRDRCREPVEKGHRHGVLGDRPLPNPSFRSGTGSRFPLTMTSRARCPRYSMRAQWWSQSTCSHAMPTLGATSACAAGRGYIPRRIATRSAASAHGVRSAGSTANPDGTE
jgi:hypothetical protein